MAETRFTPGPYSVSLDGKNTYRAEVIGKSPRGKPIVLARIPTPNRSPDQALANGNLFAAAPTLYKALDRFANAWDAGWRGTPDFIPTHEQMNELHDAFDAAHRALAKARGEES